MPTPKTGPIPPGSKVIGYARVSTDEQLKSGYSLQEQAERLRQHAADYGLVLDGASSRRG
jgi:DNA invertase Pin-like site-specific DNA recombinase